MYIPGELVTLITFPGVIMHEISHRFMCDILNVPVYEARYFIIGSKTAGYVLHEKTDNILKSFLISFAPLIINSIVCMLFTLPTSIIEKATDNTNLGYLITIPWWIGLSCGIHAFPSTHDVDVIKSEVEEQEKQNFLISLACNIINFLHRINNAVINIMYAIILSKFSEIIFFKII